MDSLNTLMTGLKVGLDWEDKIGMDGIKAHLTFPNFDIQHSFYEYTISAKDKKGAWISAAGGKYDSSIANQHYSWTAPNTGHSLKFVDAVIGRSSSNPTDVLVIRDFRLDETLFTDVKLDVRYLPNTIKSDRVGTLTVTRRDED